MKKIIYLALIILIIGCDSDEDHPSLKVVNQTNDSNSKSITSVRLVDYEFTNLSIDEGNSQTFNLDSGMSGGYENINIIVRLSGPQTIYENIGVNFDNEETTTITMKGCISSEGCDGFYLE